MDTESRIVARLGDIKAEIARLDAEAQELETALRVVRRFGTEAHPPSVPANPRKTGPTTRDYIESVLSKSDDPWMTANEIQEKVSEIKGIEVPMSSISPTLSQMKDNVIIRKGLHVALKSRVEANEAPSDLLEGASSS